MGVRVTPPALGVCHPQCPIHCPSVVNYWGSIFGLVVSWVGLVLTDGRFKKKSRSGTLKFNPQTGGFMFRLSMGL
jgi:hypothetical protein